MKFSRAGLEDYSNSISIDNVNIFEKVQLEGLLSTPASDESPTIQNSFYLAYSLIKRPQVGWYVESVKYASKGMFEEREETEFFIKLINFWVDTEGIVVPKTDVTEQVGGEESGLAASVLV